MELPETRPTVDSGTRPQWEPPRLEVVGYVADVVRQYVSSPSDKEMDGYS